MCAAPSLALPLSGEAALEAVVLAEGSGRTESEKASLGREGESKVFFVAPPGKNLLGDSKREGVEGVVVD